MVEELNNWKVIILAAGDKAIGDGAAPMVLQTLGDRAILDYVVANARQLVEPDDIYVVVGYRAEDVIAHLGSGYHYVVQEEALGTGHAVLQVLPQLHDFDGDLLILYGDTPLFRGASIRGLLKRHQLRQADLTLLAPWSTGICPTVASFVTPAGASWTSSKPRKPQPACVTFVK